ncbi:hypothetical protein A3I95_02155 [Candidatus Nomurabacteria bacterium RIFCSPLOWO2_02_FULL_44_12]|nr:MAG: hypothetical protein A3I95_02155 [Candidatus Nomurabacteria bacterium RIFCSPLOWO2_02_FULL_44_12]
MFLFYHACPSSGGSHNISLQEELLFITHPYFSAEKLLVLAPTRSQGVLKSNSSFHPINPCNLSSFMLV